MPQPDSRRTGAGLDASFQPAQPGEGEVLISGVNTGPGDAERENRTPTEDHARFQAHTYPRDNEDA